MTLDAAALGAQQTQDSGSHPAPGAPIEEILVANVNSVELMQIGLDQGPLLEQFGPGYFWVPCRGRGVPRRRFVPFVEPRGFVELAAADPMARRSARFGACVSGWPAEAQYVSAAFMPVLIHIMAVRATWRNHTHGTWSSSNS